MIMVAVMTEEEVPNTTFLKSVVIILGILIIGVAAAIGVILYKRATATPQAEAAQAAEAPLAVSQTLSVVQRKFGDIDIKAPEGMSAIGVTISDDRLLVIYGTDQATPKVVVILSQKSGEEIGRIRL
ncbi:MAG: hypothetical protein ACJAYR_000729 [Sneathiella sp.]|jgi:hypothetical protein